MQQIGSLSHATELQGGPEGPTGPFPPPPCWILRALHWDVAAGPGAPCPVQECGGQAGGADAEAFPLQLHGQATQQIPQPHLALQLSGAGPGQGFSCPPVAGPEGMALTPGGLPHQIAGPRLRSRSLSGLSLPGHPHPPAFHPLLLFWRKWGGGR